MINNNSATNIELLAPAGSMEALIAAVNGGADAVYLGGKSFGARRSASNFDDEEMIKAITYCHQRNVSVYVTVNTLVKQEELESVMAFISFLYHNQVDAVILQDIGLLKKIKEIYPDLQCHASTQMTFHSLSGVQMAEKMGFSRVVLSRELSFEEIKCISEATKLEIEFFVHGALCISYSGQCLMSSHIGGRSGNRGACAQPCRKKYRLLNRANGKVSEVGYLMSPKDMMTAKQIESFKTLDRVSLKVEGRMKGADYVYSVVSSYRKALDSQYADRIEDSLKRTFNRQLSTGFMFENTYKEIMNYQLPSSYGTEVAKSVGYADGKVKLKLIDELNKGDEIQYRVGTQNFGTRADLIYLNGQRVNRAAKGDVIEVPFKTKVPSETVFFKTYDKNHIDEMTQKSTVERKRETVSFQFEAVKGLPANLKAIFSGSNQQCYQIHSEKKVEKALKVALTEERIKEQLSKLGGTPFELDHIVIKMDEDATMPISEINSMRRQLLDMYLEDKCRRYPERQNKFINTKSSFAHNTIKALETTETSILKDQVSAEQGELVLVFSQYEALIRAYEIFDSYGSKAVPIHFVLDNIEAYHANFELLNQRKVGIKLPRIIRNKDEKRVVELIDRFLKFAEFSNQSNAAAIHISHIGQLMYLEDKYNDIRGTHHLNMLNSECAKALHAAGITNVTWSYEMSQSELEKTKDVNTLSTIWIYGRVPLMISEYCPVGGVMTGRDNCNLCTLGSYALIDEHETAYPLRMNRATCQAEVLSEEKLYLLDQVKNLMAIGIKSFEMSFDELDAFDIELLDRLAQIKTIDEMVKIKINTTQKTSRGRFFSGIE